MQALFTVATNGGEKKTIAEGERHFQAARSAGPPADLPREAVRLRPFRLLLRATRCLVVN